jgi:hypothetical protein
MASNELKQSKEGDVKRISHESNSFSMPVAGAKSGGKYAQRLPSRSDHAGGMAASSRIVAGKRAAATICRRCWLRDKRRLQSHQSARLLSAMRRFFQPLPGENSPGRSQRAAGFA